MTSPSESERPAPNTLNDGIILAGENLPNHSTSMRGRGKFVGSGMQHAPQWRTKQELYRFVGWALVMEEAHQLPDEDGAHTLEEIMEAIRRV